MGSGSEKDLGGAKQKASKGKTGLNPDMEIDHVEERRRDEIRTEREAKEREAELVTRLSRVEEEGEQLGEEVARLLTVSPVSPTCLTTGAGQSLRQLSPLCGVKTD